MIRGAVQMVSAWLAHATHGVNAIAATIPHAGDDAPRVVEIYNTSDHPAVARTFSPDSTPALVVWCEPTALRGSVRGYRVLRELVIGVAYVTDDEADEATSRAEGDYLMRAALLSFARFNQESIAKAYRKKNGVVIGAVGEADYAQVTGASGRFRTWAMLGCTLTVADTVGARTPAMPGEFAGV
jgi:hypothetical protein